MRPSAKFLFLVFFFLITIPGGCKPREAEPERGAKGPGKGVARSGPSQVKVLCSFLPIWVFTKNVVGDQPGVDVDMLIPGHQGPHDYQLTPGDMRKINQARLFIVSGFGLEAFLIDEAKKANPGLIILEAADSVKPIHVDREGHGHHGREQGGINPHPFASPGDAALMVRRIGEALAVADPGRAHEYSKNAKEYASRLEALANEFREVVRAAPNKKVATFHSAFDYLARDTGLEIVATIETVPGQKPSAGELAGLIKKVREAGAIAVFGEPQFSPGLARVLAEEAGIKLDFLDPAATGEMDPRHYETVMKKNLETLKRILEDGK